MTTRGQKHLRELSHMVALGHRAILLFVVQHSGITSVRPARHIDPQYADLLQQAVSNGVEVLAYKTQCSSQGSLIT
ncbi:DNA/RNA nuclease SfsA, partial [Psychrobacter sp. TB55-MNA-CIBAN-0194]|uniref:DNA/RNA nuclease SfsA n=1 Tax=Psychrobacter sp. TB55-MNA-CIBAN-0194 TaxID=3140445 RepID=UPI003328DB87